MARCVSSPTSLGSEDGIMAETVNASLLVPGDLYTLRTPSEVIVAYGLGLYASMQLQVRHTRAPERMSGTTVEVTRVRYITATLREDATW